MKPFTQIPNEVLDNQMRRLNGSEYKVLEQIHRKTTGFHKTSDHISYRQLMELTGLSRTSVWRALKGLEEKGLINRESYQLHLQRLSVVEAAPVAIYDEANALVNSTTGEAVSPQEGEVIQSVIHNIIHKATEPAAAVQPGVSEGENAVAEVNRRVSECNEPVSKWNPQNIIPKDSLPKETTTKPAPVVAVALEEAKKAEHRPIGEQLLEQALAEWGGLPSPLRLDCVELLRQVGLDRKPAIRLTRLALDRGRPPSYLVNLARYCLETPEVKSPAGLIVRLIESDEERLPPQELSKARRQSRQARWAKSNPVETEWYEGPDNATLVRRYADGRQERFQYDMSHQNWLLVEDSDEYEDEEAYQDEAERDPWDEEEL